MCNVLLRNTLEIYSENKFFNAHTLDIDIVSYSASENTAYEKCLEIFGYAENLVLGITVAKDVSFMS
jgi:hypothetical protein